VHFDPTPLASNWPPLHCAKYRSSSRSRFTGRRTGIATSPFPRRAVWAQCANALTVTQFGSPRRDPPCDPGGRSRDLRSTRPIGRSSRRLIEAGNTGACNAGLQCVSCLPLDRYPTATGLLRYAQRSSNNRVVRDAAKINRIFRSFRFSGRHAITV
jgi:hypothetical protein